MHHEAASIRRAIGLVRYRSAKNDQTWLPPSVSSRLDQQHARIGPPLGHRERDQPAGKPAADDRKVTLADAFHTGCLAGAGARVISA